MFNQFDQQPILAFPEGERSRLLSEGLPLSIDTQKLDFKKQYPDLHSIYVTLGLAQGEWKSQKINCFTRQPDNEDFTNIGEHMIAVSLTLDAIARPLVAWGIISDQDWLTAKNLVLVHDLNRVFEIYEKKAFGVITQERSLAEMSRVLPILGMSESQVKFVRHACAVTTYDGLGMFLVRNSQGEIEINPNSSVSDRLARLADDMTCSRNGKHLLFTPLERFIAAGYFVDPDKDPNLWKQAEITTDGKVIVDPLEISPNSLSGQIANLHMISADLSILNLLNHPSVPQKENDACSSLGPQEYLKNLAARELGLME